MPPLSMQGLIGAEEHPINNGVIVVQHQDLLRFLQSMTRDGVRISMLSMQGSILDRVVPFSM